VTVENGVLNRILRVTQADVFVAFQDIFLFEPGPLICPSLVWMPCHFMPLEHKTLRSLNSFDGIVAMSHYGRSFLRNYFGPERCGPNQKLFEYVPHGRGLDLFRPLEGRTALTKAMPPQSFCDKRNDLRDALGWPRDAFVVLIVAANTEGSNRKAFDAQLSAFCKFAQRRDNRESLGLESDLRPTFLHVHSMADGEMDLARIMEMHGEMPHRNKFIDIAGDNGKTKVYDPNIAVQGPRFKITPAAKYGRLSEKEMVDMYHAADVTMVGTCAEGFGVPIIEAQLCGCPVITNRTTAMPELTRFGISARPSQWISRNDFVSGWQQPNRDGLADALDTVSSWSPLEIAQALRSKLPLLQKRYSSDAVLDGWTSVFHRMEEKL